MGIGDIGHQIRLRWTRSIIVPVVIYFGMRLGLFDDILDFCLLNFSSTNRTFLFFWKFVLDIAAEVVLFSFSLHEPVSVEANQVESMVARVDADKVYSLGELLIVILVLLVLLSSLCSLVLFLG